MRDVSRGARCHLKRRSRLSTTLLAISTRIPTEAQPRASVVQATEDFMVHLLEDCNLCAIHAKRVTISASPGSLACPLEPACINWQDASPAIQACHAQSILLQQTFCRHT